MEPRSHCADRHVENVGDLLVGEIVHEVQRGHGSELVRQRRQRANDVALCHARDCARGGIGVGTKEPGFRTPGVQKDLVRVTEFVERGGRAAFAARRRVEVIDDDSIEPGLEARPSLEGIAEAKRSESRLLDEILRVLRIASQPQREAIRRVQHPDEQRLELLIGDALVDRCDIGSCGIAHVPSGGNSTPIPATKVAGSNALRRRKVITSSADGATWEIVARPIARTRSWQLVMTVRPKLAPVRSAPANEPPSKLALRRSAPRSDADANFATGASANSKVANERSAVRQSAKRRQAPVRSAPAHRAPNNVACIRRAQVKRALCADAFLRSAWCMKARVNTASSRRAPAKPAYSSRASVKSAPRSSAFWNCAPLRSAPSKLAPSSAASRKSAMDRSLPRKSAPRSSTPANDSRGRDLPANVSVANGSPATDDAESVVVFSICSVT